jgi:nicotinamide riboside kinase
MNIGICGAHCTGKTSLIEEFCKDDNYIKFIEGIRSLIAEYPQYKDAWAKGDETLQFIYLLNHVKTLHELSVDFNNIITDRTVIDNYAYYELLEDVKYPDMYKGMVLENLYLYNIIFYIPIEFPFIDEDGRFKADTREQVDKNIKKFLDENNIKYYTLTGTIEERLAQMKKVISNFGR